jgi:hypothetical protein
MAYPPTSRTTPSRSAERVAYDRATVHAVLDEAVVCHVGFVVDGRPVVLPQLEKDPVPLTPRSARPLDGAVGRRPGPAWTSA